MTSAEWHVEAITGRPVRRIAVVRALQLGDLLLAVPALRAIRRGYPDAEITLIGLPWASSFVTRFSDYLDRFREFPGFPGIHEVDHDPCRTARFLNTEVAYGYDLVIQAHGSGVTSNPFALALGGGVTAAFYEGEPPPGVTIGACYPGTLPEIWRNLELARLLGCPADDPSLEFPLTADDRHEARRLLAGVPHDRPLVGIHPGATIAARRWQPERFAVVADDLATAFGARIVITGGPGEEAVAARVARQMSGEALVVAGETSLGGLGAIINQCDLFISNDTGPAHIAVALDVPSVIVFGPSELHRWAPLDGNRHQVVVRDVACRPCGHAVCPIDHRCLDWIAPEAVIETASRLLGRRQVEVMACAD
ncbi:MAG: glycosyltransferase family 9 protein [Chloroflexota bacterium]|nr:glycosyltransferase family 9 protein [Chloroflexota bacterium]